MLDNLHNLVPGEYLELGANGVPLELGNPGIVGLFNANNFATPPAVPLGCLNGTERPLCNPFGGYADIYAPFGLTGTQLPRGVITSLADNNGAFDLAFQSRSDGSFDKETVAEAIPEPASLALLGLGLAGLGWSRRRK